MKRLTTGAACAFLTVCLLTGCTSARSNLGTSDSSCYLALPAASHAVGGHGHLVGVRSYTLAGLRKAAPNLFQLVADRQPNSEKVCIVAFTGFFRSSSVSDPHGRPSGRLAVVVTTIPDNRLLGTVIFLRVPLRFGHSHIG
jgi:hypothetical protein